MTQKIKSNATPALSFSGHTSFRPVEAHRAETSQDTTSHCHPEERSDVRVLEQVGTVIVSQGPHGGKAPSGRRERCEGGRSMVEMLGTLAIMGVLSIGGVAGYRYAMDKLNANTILSEISKRAMTASQQRLIGQSINLNEYGAAKIQDFDVTHTNDVDGDTAFFSLTVADVPKGICDKVIENKLRTVSEVWLNTDTDVTDGGSCDDGENNTIEFVFENTLNTNVVAGKFDYDNCPESFYQCSTTHSCVTSENDCPSLCAVNEELSSGCVCPEHRDRTGGVCGNCVDVENYEPWTQPVLTSNGIMGGNNAFACSASGELGTRKAWRAFDNSNENPETDCWHSSYNNDWLSWYTQKPTKIKSLVIHNRGDGGAVGVLAVADFQIQYSDDNSSWTTVVSGKNPSNSPYDSYSQTVDAASGHNYWRIYILSGYLPNGTTSTGDDYRSIGEVTINADEVTSVTDYELNESGYCEIVE